MQDKYTSKHNVDWSDQRLCKLSYSVSVNRNAKAFKTFSKVILALPGGRIKVLFFLVCFFVERCGRLQRQRRKTTQN